MDYSYIDIIILIPLIFALIKGFRKGLILELATLAGLILGIYAAKEFSQPVSDWLNALFDIQNSLLVFGLTFAIVLIGLYFLGKLLEKLIKLVAMGWLNKIGGAVFSLAKWGAIISVILLIVDKVNDSYTLIENENLNKSVLYKPVKDFTPTILPFVEDLGNFDLNSPQLDSIQVPSPSSIGSELLP